MNLIKQIVRPGEYGTQTIKMVVKSSERGAQGEKGEKGDSATITAGNAYSVEEGQSPAVINTGTSSDAVFDFYIPKGPKGDDGAIQYTAGTGINITSENVIEATGDATAAWGGIQGNIASQTDLQNEFGLYTKTADLPNLSTAYVGTNNLVDGAVATAKIADGAVTTAKINDGSVTASKFAQYATNNAIITANNLTPTADTPSAWINLLGGTDGAFPAGKGGYFFGYYNVVDSFTNQPSQYGWLETIVEGSGIYQRWADHANGPVYYRLGNQHGWEGVSAGSGSFKVLLDRKTVHTTAGTLIPASSDLNTLDFIQPGEYRCGYANASTLTNCPTDTAFKMATNNIMGGGTAVSTSSTWIYLNREITDIDGRVWTQTVTSDGNSPVTWTFGEWKRLLEYTYASVHGRPLETPSANNVDVNSFTKSGIYRCYNPVSNGPVNPEYATVFVTSYSDDFRCTQYFNAIGDGGSGGIYARFSYYDYTTDSRKWTAWKTLVTWP